jgi:hypothetical protein
MLRKYDVFGRRIGQVKFVYLLVLIFIVILAGYFGLTALQNHRLETLRAEETLLNQQITAVRTSLENQTYHEIGEIIQSLPNTYQQMELTDEIEYVQNLSGLSAVDDLVLTIDPEAQTPFEEDLPSTIRFVQITLTMTLDDSADILTFMDNLLDQDRLYHIDAVSVQLTDGGGAYVEMVVYTFYNDVIV